MMISYYSNVCKRLLRCDGLPPVFLIANETVRKTTMVPLPRAGISNDTQTLASSYSARGTALTLGGVLDSHSQPLKNIRGIHGAHGRAVQPDGTATVTSRREPADTNTSCLQATNKKNGITQKQSPPPLTITPTPAHRSRADGTPDTEIPRSPRPSPHGAPNSSRVSARQRQQQPLS